MTQGFLFFLGGGGGGWGGEDGGRMFLFTRLKTKSGGIASCQRAHIHNVGKCIKLVNLTSVVHYCPILAFVVSLWRYPVTC